MKGDATSRPPVVGGQQLHQVRALSPNLLGPMAGNGASISYNIGDRGPDAAPKEEEPVIIVHHLNDSRSQRILWLLEELALPYQIERYERNAQTRLAPPELKAVHPLGKSPVITDDGRVIHESAAIIDYVIRHHGRGKLQPAPETPAYDDYVQWLHYAEGSAMLPLLLNLYATRLGEAKAPLMPRIDGEIANHLGYIDGALKGRQFLLGSDFTGVDIQMSFVGEIAGAYGKRAAYPDLDAWVKRLHARPAYKAALERGGAYGLAN
jgi:glutathione S-transferase